MPGSTGLPPADRPAASDLVQTFSALQSLLLTAQDIEGFLTEVAKLAAGVAHPAASCGITIRRHGQPLTVASSDARAEQVDQAQYGAGTGPCLDSLETGAIIDVPDLTADTRWTDFRHQALAHGIRSSVSIPLSIDGSTVGALNLYGPQPHAFDQATRQHAEAFATQAATALTLALRNGDQAKDTAQLEQALASRTVIDQALGILMAQQRCTAEDAFALLRAHSQDNNRKLHDVAADLITRVSGQPPTMREARNVLTQVWYIDLDDQTRLHRLVSRHVTHGKTADDARDWTLGTDQVNAELVASSRDAANLRIRLK